jgi:hypothetical protein
MVQLYRSASYSLKMAVNPLLRHNEADTKRLANCSFHGEISMDRKRQHT